MSTSTTFEPLEAQVEIKTSVQLTEATVTVFPNPFTERVQVVYELPQDDLVQIGIFNAVGQRVATLVNERQSKGTHRIAWEGPNGKFNQTGLFLITVKIGDTVKTRRVMRLK